MQLLLPLSLILLFIFLPLYLRKIANSIQLSNLLSDVVVCFGVGVLIGNTQSWWMPNTLHQELAFSIAETSTAASVLVAIPMLLMTSNISASIRYAPKFLISFGLCILAVLIATLFTIYCFPNLEYLSETAGCLVGVYTGGTPNMVAISYAIKAPNELFVILNTTDLFCSGLYFIFLTSIAKPFYSLFLSPSRLSQTNNYSPLNKEPILSDSLQDETKSSTKLLTNETILPIFKSLIFSFICIGVSVGLGLLFATPNGGINEMLLMIVLSTSSILLSFHPKIQGLKGVYEFAQYLLLIFALAVGFMADFTKLADVGITYLSFNAILVISLLILHLILGIWFKIDTDTFIITSTACVFGPPFIGQVCSAIKNKEMLAPGMALGVLGLIIGTYLGILVTNIIGYYF
ncbi:DUF819 family protein [Aureispira anguillae]|uniref:DUF819 family protein n=1 Tax=Aureispira anguillae TaxID=2864201 RepID=A0A916DVB4_9BACT|nr:DUF819 family protein [Aureispira anguillae]BDS13542.1 DUF819 family protein [Aureispira anguillae]